MAIAIHATLLWIKIPWNPSSAEIDRDLKTINMTLARVMAATPKPPAPSPEAVQPKPVKLEPVLPPIPKPPEKKPMRPQRAKKTIRHRKMRIVNAQAVQKPSPPPAERLETSFTTASDMASPPADHREAGIDMPYVNDGISPSQTASNQISDATPLYKKNTSPSYPQVARRRNIQGTVIILATVSEEGRVTEAKVDKSSGFDVLDNAALSAIRMWEFVPGKRGNTPVQSLVKLPITFQLK